MIEPHVFLLADHGTSVELQVTVVDTSSTGVKAVSVRDKDRLEIFSAAPPTDSCPIEFTFTTPPIPSSRFPVFIEGVDCSDRVSGSEEPVPLLPPGAVDGSGIPRACSPLNCMEPSPACGDALGALERVRGRIVEKCAELNALRAQRDAWIALAITFAVAALIMFAVAVAAAFVPFAGQGFVAIFAGIGALFLALSIVFGSLAAKAEFEIEAGRRELGALQMQFLEEVANVREHCCVACISNDLNVPSCP